MSSLELRPDSRPPAGARTTGYALGPAPVITDPTYTPKENPGPIDRFFLTLINDPRDLPFCHFMVEATLLLIPMAVSLYLFAFPWWVAPLYWAVNVGWFMDRFILILHCSSHRPLFKKKYGWLNHYLPWVLGPFMGETPETYFAHHVGMHHPENNLADDLSTTMPFRRDSALGWLKYFFTFLFTAMVQLARYHVARGKGKLARIMLVGEVGFFVTAAVLFAINPRATLVVFVGQLLICRFLMMAGNWAQHAFIDGSDPANPFKNSITVVNCRYNRRSFNDGYHIGHHRLATRHWTEMPVEFQRDLQKYADNDAILFEGLDFTAVWALLMLKRYDTLAKHFVELRAERRSQDEIIALLRERTKPLAAPRRARLQRLAPVAAAAE